MAHDLAQFYHEHRRQLFACALAVTRCGDAAEDAIHEAFAGMLRNGAARSENLKAYVFRSVRNAAIDHLRRQRPIAEGVLEAFFDPRPSPGASAELREQEEGLKRALALLDEAPREIIMQHIYGELTFREIAEVQGIPLATATSRYRRGLALLRERLTEVEGGA